MTLLAIELYKMKASILCLVFICGVVQATTWEFPEELMEDYMRECLEELKLDKSILSKIFDEKLRITDLDEDGTRMLQCGLKKGDIFSADGTMNRELVLKHIVKTMGILGKGDSEKTAEEIFDKCGGKKGKDDMERIKHWSYCVSDEMEKL